MDQDALVSSAGKTDQNILMMKNGDVSIMVWGGLSSAETVMLVIVNRKKDGGK